MNILWRLYIFLLPCLGAARMVERILADSGGVASRYAPLLLTILLAIGVYGQLSRRAIFKRWLWLLVYGASIAISLGLLVLAGYLLLFVGAGTLSGIGLIILTVAALIPAQYQLRRYSAASTQCW